MTLAAQINPQMVLQAYTVGAFPMATHRHGPVAWYTADPRAVLPLDPGQAPPDPPTRPGVRDVADPATLADPAALPPAFHLPRSLRKYLKKQPFTITRDRAFARVIRACAQPRPYAKETWINDQIISVYTELHEMGFGHSIEAWGPAGEDEQPTTQDQPQQGLTMHQRARSAPQRQAKQAEEIPPAAGRLVGGLYGIAIGGVFFAESMFSRCTNASKVCLVHLVQHLQQQGFTLMDVQFANAHLRQFGIVDIQVDQYLRMLHKAIHRHVKW